MPYNSFVCYDLTRWGGQNGYRVFDFGRSKKSGSGSYVFRAHWGMLERELRYEILLVKHKELQSYSPNNRRFGLAIKIGNTCRQRSHGGLGLARLVPQRDPKGWSGIRSTLEPPPTVLSDCGPLSNSDGRGRPRG